VQALGPTIPQRVLHALLLVASLLWFALTALTGPGTWRR
jgi:hypothetical protein